MKLASNNTKWSIPSAVSASLLLFLLAQLPCLLTDELPLGSSSGVQHYDHHHHDNDKQPTITTDCRASNCFRAAVYQHSRLDVGRDEGCQLSVRLNLDVYEKAAELAGQNGAKIIVFPEDGLFVGSRSFMLPCLHHIPDVQLNKTINPCLDKGDHDDYGEHSIIMKRLSCMARRNGLYLVANFGTRENCSTEQLGHKETNSSCEKYGYLMLNTNVAFDERGNFIKRYRKYNPFIETFDGAPQLELAYFDTPHMGRFGLFTCFDILFKSPAIDLVERYQINTALYPTWWFDKLPMHSAIQYQEAWAQSNSVNLLAANLVAPQRGSIGSGIFSSCPQTNSIYTGADDPGPKLILADLPVVRQQQQQQQQTRRPPNDDEHCTCLQDENNKSSGLKLDLSAPLLANNHKLARRTNKTITTPADGKPYRPYGHFEVDDSDHVVALGEGQDKVSVCLADLCCHLEYQTSGRSSRTNEPMIAPHNEQSGAQLVLIVKSGINKQFGWWEEVCLLATTASPQETNSEGTTGNTRASRLHFDLEGSYEFRRLSISANFSTKYVMPIANRNVSQLVDRLDRRFICRQLNSKQVVECKQELASEMPGIINSFGFFARRFDKDQRRPARH